MNFLFAQILLQKNRQKQKPRCYISNEAFVFNYNKRLKFTFFSFGSRAFVRTQVE